MKIRDIDDKHIISTPDLPTDRMQYYLGRTGANSLKELTFEQRKKIFLLSIKDFMDGRFSVDALASFSIDLHDYKADFNAMNAEEKELYNATESGSELSFYVRKFPEMFGDFMSQVKTYFEKYFPF